MSIGIRLSITKKTNEMSLFNVYTPLSKVKLFLRPIFIVENLRQIFIKKHWTSDCKSKTSDLMQKHLR